MPQPISTRLSQVVKQTWARFPFLARLPFWLLVVFLAAALAHFPLVALTALFLLGAIAVRAITRRTLWTVRNRLIATYLLMGLAPVVLFALLAGIAAYLFSGQFATNTALASIDEQLLLMKQNALAFQGYIGHAGEMHPHAAAIDITPIVQSPRTVLPGGGELTVMAWLDGKPLPLTGKGAARQSLPGWPQPGFAGVVEEGNRLYLRAVEGFTDQDSLSPHTFRVAVSTPLTRERLGAIAHNLGTVFILPAPALRTDEDALEGKRPPDPDPEIQPLSGGALTPAGFFIDPPVAFTAPLHVFRWQTGALLPAGLGVASRASLLYGRLFSSSVRIGAIVRTTLISLAVLFALLEGLALFLAFRLSRTITRSVGDLYRATMEIDRGNFAHRIQVRQRDQLGVLSASFNRMAASLADLLEQQREKQRLENELSIAQQVQNNLFPRAPAHLPGFELHGACKPARTVSGDYYDFFPGGSRFLFALGDISGKGISAALLMASLHAAVRAFSSIPGEGYTPAPDLPHANGTSYASPGRMLSLLNQHLLASTQPEKYATLFLASYNPHTRELTYSNAGQPPPLLLRTSGLVERLDRGGSVIGLLPNQSYLEATVTLQPGDLVAAYSDGVTEPENAFGEYGEERLLSFLQARRAVPLAQISSQAMQSLRSWIGAEEQPDDITLLLARQL